MKLLIEALIKFTCGLLMVALLLFLPAGTLQYTYGWLLIGLLFGPMLIAGIVMYCKNPAFLQKRLDAKEKQSAQKGVLAFSGLMFVVGFVLCGGPGLSVRLVENAFAGNDHSFCTVFDGLCPVCGSDAGKRILKPHH